MASQSANEIRDKRFAAEYLVDFNATRAAIRIGTPEKSASSVGSKLLRRPAVAKLIEKELDTYVMSSREAMVRLSQMATADMGDFINNDGTFDLKSVKEDSNLSRLVSKYKRYTNPAKGEDRVEFELYSSYAALVKILEVHARLEEGLAASTAETRIGEVLSQFAEEFGDNPEIMERLIAFLDRRKAREKELTLN